MASFETTNRPGTRESARPDLPRVLNVWAATAVVVGTIVGSGIFLVPQEMMRAAGSSGLVYLAWLVGGLLTLCGAMTYAELSAVRPEAGGEYVFLRDAYGNGAAFLYMWTWFAVAKPASIASVTTGFARTLGLFASFAFLDSPVLRHPFPVLWSQIVAIAATWFATGLNYLGMRAAGGFQLVMTWFKVVLVGAVIAVCFVHAGGAGWANFATRFTTGATGRFSGFMVALIAALWAYDGWNDLTMVGGEVRNPQRNLPIALVAGVGVVGVLYVGVNAAIQYVLPASAIAAAPRPALAAVEQVMGPGRPWAAGVLMAGMAISILVGLNGTVMSGARVPFASARDGMFFRDLARIHPRFCSPSVSLVVQGVLSTALLLLVGRFQQLFELAIFSEWLFYMLSATTIFVFRRREPARFRPFRTPGYPVVPLLFVAAAGLLLVYSYVSNLPNSLIGTGVILLGLPLYGYFNRRRVKEARRDAAG
jgi:APA family basic amino acid/polyamine antiporter